MEFERLQYERANGPTEVYEVYSDRESLGLVWLKDGVWFADRHSMMAPEVSEERLEAAGRRLLAMHRHAAEAPR